MGKKPPSHSKMKRLMKIGGLTSRVSSSYLGQRVVGAFQNEDTRKKGLRRLHLENAERMADTMGALKGAAMKLGQSIAVVADGMDVPPEVGRILGKLHASAESIPFAVIRDEIEHNLEGKIDDLFSRFDTEPLGTASLAQAHAAWLPDGTPVVVKVLHRGIEASVDTDIAALRSVFVTGRVLRRDPRELNAILDEIKDRLNEELDYYKEAANLEYFADAMGHLDGVQIPRSYPAYCTDRVLTMDRIHGEPLDKFLETATPEARKRAGDLLILIFHQMLYGLRALHADPHGGNYLFQRDGSVGLIDFGCVKRYDLYYVANYARLAQAMIRSDRGMVNEFSRALGILVGADDLEADDILWELADVIADPFRTDNYTCGGPDDDILDRVRRVAPKLLLRKEIQSPSELVYLHRVLAGIYAMLRKLEHQAELGRELRKYTNLVIDEAEGRTNKLRLGV